MPNPDLNELSREIIEAEDLREIGRRSAAALDRGETWREPEAPLPPIIRVMSDGGTIRTRPGQINYPEVGVYYNTGPRFLPRKHRHCRILVVNIDEPSQQLDGTMSSMVEYRVGEGEKLVTECALRWDVKRSEHQ